MPTYAVAAVEKQAGNLAELLAYLVITQSNLEEARVYHQDWEEATAEVLEVVFGKATAVELIQLGTFKAPRPSEPVDLHVDHLERQMTTQLAFLIDVNDVLTERT